MASDLSPSVLTIKTCKIPSLSSYPVKYPTYNHLSVRDLERTINFHPKEKLPCKNTWYRDLKSTHIRNRRLLDLPFRRPKCCSDIYNIILDRQKLKKVQKYGLTRPVRKITPSMEMEVVKRCIPKVIPGERVTYFPECYIPVDSSSDDEDDEEDKYDLCATDSVSECSGCSTLGGRTRSRLHKVLKKDWRDLLHHADIEVCQDAVAQEMSKHKLGQNFQLKLKKVF